MGFARAAALGAVFAVAMATSAFAKGHNQGDTETPGKDVGTETVGPSHTEGEEQGNRPADKGPKADNPAVGNAGR